MNENIVVETSKIVDSVKIDIEIEVELKPTLPPYTNASSIVNSTTNCLNGHEFIETIHRVYNECNEGKTFSSFLLRMQPKCSYKNSHHGLNILTISLKVYITLPLLFLQGPTRNNKARDHTKKIDKQLLTWKGGKINDLIKEGRIIQERIKSSCQRASKDYAKIFGNLMMQGKVQP